MARPLHGFRLRLFAWTARGGECVNYNWNWGIFWDQTPDATGTYFAR
jgi:hypothetical protein